MISVVPRCIFEALSWYGRLNIEPKCFRTRFKKRTLDQTRKNTLSQSKYFKFYIFFDKAPNHGGSTLGTTLMSIKTKINNYLIMYKNCSFPMLSMRNDLKIITQKSTKINCTSVFCFHKKDYEMFHVDK